VGEGESKHSMRIGLI